MINYKWFRFLISGGVNTLFTYSLYLLFTMVLNYQAAYLLAYLFGIIFGYIVNSLFVFKVNLALRTLFTYPALYLINYAISALLLLVSVEIIGLNVKYAPLCIITITTPISYLLNNLFLVHIGQKLQSKQR
jgi:putative flippase GtrA